MEQAENNSPGKLLSAARIAANMSREHVAAQLHLSISVIEDLENDHYPASVNLVFILNHRFYS